MRTRRLVSVGGGGRLPCTGAKQNLPPARPCQAPHAHWHSALCHPPTRAPVRLALNPAPPPESSDSDDDFNNATVAEAAARNAYEGRPGADRSAKARPIRYKEFSESGGWVGGGWDSGRPTVQRSMLGAALQLWCGATCPRARHRCRTRSLAEIDESGSGSSGDESDDEAQSAEGEEESSAAEAGEGEEQEGEAGSGEASGGGGSGSGTEESGEGGSTASGERRKKKRGSGSERSGSQTTEQRQQVGGGGWSGAARGGTCHGRVPRGSCSLPCTPVLGA